MDRYGTDRKAIRYNGNIVQGYGFLKNMTFVLIRKEKKKKKEKKNNLPETSDR